MFESDFMKLLYSETEKSINTILGSNLLVIQLLYLIFYYLKG